MKVEVKQYFHGGALSKVFFISNGYHKHFLYFDNADYINGLVYFCVVLFDDVDIDIPCDHGFWKEWLDFYCYTNGVTKRVNFIGEDVPILKNKVSPMYKSIVLFSGGKDSRLSYEISHKAHALIFSAQHYSYDNTLIQDAEYFTSNVDNELFHSAKHLRGKLHLELLFPLLNSYSETLMGIEKEVWFNKNSPMLYNMANYRSLLSRHGLIFNSPVKFLDSAYILNNLKELDIKFVKCNRVGEDDFCYQCEKCLTYFIMGCNKEKHDFDREKFLLRQPKLLEHKDIHLTIDKVVTDNRSRLFMHSIADEYKNRRNDV